MAGTGIEAEEALAWGLIDRITPPETLMEMVSSLAADPLQATAAHVAAIKAMTQ